MTSLAFISIRSSKQARNQILGWHFRPDGAVIWTWVGQFHNTLDCIRVKQTFAQPFLTFSPESHHFPNLDQTRGTQISHNTEWRFPYPTPGVGHMGNEPRIHSVVPRNPGCSGSELAEAHWTTRRVDRSPRSGRGWGSSSQALELGEETNLWRNKQTCGGINKLVKK